MKLFKVGDQFLVYLHEEHGGIQHKLDPKKINPLQIIQNINENANILGLTDNMKSPKPSTW